MSFLHDFFQNVFQDNTGPDALAGHTSAAPVPASYEQASREQLRRHLETSRYGDFELTEAVRPAIDLKVRPTQGYRHDLYRDEESNSQVPVILASVSAEFLFDVFMQLMDRIGSPVDVVLETSHNHDTVGHTDLYREQMDIPVLKSILWEYENLLTNDGCTGIAVLNPRKPQEIQLDEHKLIVIYGSPLEPYEHILERNGIRHNPHIHFITEAEHVHSSSEEFYQQFNQLKTDLGLDVQ